MRIKLLLHHLKDMACELNLDLYLSWGLGCREQSFCFTTSGIWLASSISLFTQANAFGDANKVAASPPWEVGLRAQSRYLPRLTPLVMLTKLLLHHLEKVVCELNLSIYPGWGLGWREQSCRFTTSERWLVSSISLFTEVEALGLVNKVATWPPRGGGLWAQSHYLPRLKPWVTQAKVAPSPSRGGGLWGQSQCTLWELILLSWYDTCSVYA